MAKYRVRFTTAALRHLEAIAEYHLEKVGPKSAEKITSKLLDGFRILENFPFSGPEHPDAALAQKGYRKLVIEDYVGVYRKVDDIIYVYGIFHGSTDYPALFQ